jgi:exodeoxyribonuclease VII small subunit
MTPKKPAAGPGLGEELRALEEIVRRLESDETDLDEALTLFEDGVARLRRARARLAEAEAAVQAVLVDADGALRTVDADL